MEWYRLKCAGLTDTIIRNLTQGVKEYSEISLLHPEQLIKYFKFTQEDLIKLENSRKIDLNLEMKKLKENNIKLIFLNDENYPENLKNIAHPPIFLFCKGNIELLKGFNIGVVGTRRSTGYGRGVCEKLVEGLVEAGINTVSGLALGIDTVCHKKTLEINGQTIAVVGSGLDRIYPSENRELWKKIEEKGVVISEFPLGTEPFPYNFPQRNRIIAGLSRGIVVVESKAKGGSLITADFALEENRDVFVVPGEIFSPFSTGCNNLIKNSSGKLIMGIEDILIEYGIESNKNILTSELNLSKSEMKIYEIIIGTKTLDEIMQETGFKVSEALAILMELEMKKIVYSVGGGCYKRKEN